MLVVQNLLLRENSKKRFNKDRNKLYQFNEHIYRITLHSQRIINNFESFTYNYPKDLRIYRKNIFLYFSIYFYDIFITSTIYLKVESIYYSDRKFY